MSTISDQIVELQNLVKDSLESTNKLRSLEISQKLSKLNWQIQAQNANGIKLAKLVLQSEVETKTEVFNAEKVWQLYKDKFKQAKQILREENEIKQVVSFNDLIKQFIK